MPPKKSEKWQEKATGLISFANEVAKMMYVSGETAEPSAETTGMVEEIVRQQVIEMVSTLPLPKLRTRLTHL